MSNQFQPPPPNEPGPYGTQEYGTQPAPVAPPPPGYGYPQAGYAYPQPYAGQPGYGYVPVRPTNTFAVISLVSSLASMMVLIGWIPGIVFGHMALRQIRQTGEAGEGMAKAGLIVGYIFGALLVVGVLAYVAFFVFIFGMVGFATNSASTV